MKHTEIREKELLEQYLLQRLDEHTATEVEEHLLLCSECRKEFAAMEKIINALHSTAKEKEKPVFSPPNQFSFRPYFTQFSVAAAVLLVALFITIITLVTIGEKKIEETNVVPHQKKDSLIEKPSNTLLAENYTPNPILEEYINSPTRSDVQITIHTISTKKEDKKVILHFSGSIKGMKKEEQLIVTLFGNRKEEYEENKVIFSAPIFLKKKKDLYSFTIEKSVTRKEGLYYFIIEKKYNDDPLYVGKFFVR